MSLFNFLKFFIEVSVKKLIVIVVSSDKFSKIGLTKIIAFVVQKMFRQKVVKNS